MTPPGDKPDLRTQIEDYTDRLISQRIVVQAIVEGEEAKRQLKQMTDKLPKLAGIASALDKLTDAIEADAEKRLNKIEAVHAKRERVMTKADQKIDARDKAVDAFDDALDRLDKALGDNGGPTTEGSAESP